MTVLPMRIIKLYGDEYQCYGARVKLALSTKQSFMNYQIMPEADVVIRRTERRRINPGYRFPSVSIFMPFDPKMEMKSKLIFSLSKAIDKVVSELQDKYPGEMSLLVIQKLKAIIKKLDFNTHKKSLAIFVSPVFEKIYYLNIEVEEKIIVSESLQILDLINSKKDSQLFLILLLTEKRGRIFFSYTNSFINISPKGSLWKKDNQNELNEQAGYSSDTTSEKNILLKKFLHDIDDSLDILLKHHGLSVAVMGPDYLLQQFKSISKNKEAVIEYVDGDFEEYSLVDLKSILKFHRIEWQEIKQKNLLRQLKEAASKNNLSFGLRDVQKEAVNLKKGKLLVIEKNYLNDTDSLYNTGFWEGNSLNEKMASHFNKFSNVKNSLDQIIEKVLENGGDVELVNEGFLNEYSQIALIKN